MARSMRTRKWARWKPCCPPTATPLPTPPLWWSCLTVTCCAAGSPVHMRAAPTSTSSAPACRTTARLGCPRWISRKTPPAVSRTPRCSMALTTPSGRCTPPSSTGRPAKTTCSTRRSSAARNPPTAARRGAITPRSSPRRAHSAVSLSRFCPMAAGSSPTGSAPTLSMVCPATPRRSASRTTRARHGRWS